MLLAEEICGREPQEEQLSLPLFLSIKEQIYFRYSRNKR
jgi:hypothetical protein